jgi:hypothetical protein
VLDDLPEREVLEEVAGVRLHAAHRAAATAAGVAVVTWAPSRGGHPS